MNPEFQPIARALIILGLILCGFGLLLLTAPKIPWVGRLPGDLSLHRDGFSFYFPMTSCLLASLLVSVLFWIFGRFR